MTRPTRLALSFLGVVALPAAVVWLIVKSPPRAYFETVTFNRHIAPIVFENCAPCHHEGGSAPFSLSTYDNAKRRAQQILVVTETRYMPPWMPEPGYAEFVGERRLSDGQIGLIRRWVQQGAPEGDFLAPVPPAELPTAWQLGEPDLIINMPQPYMLAAEGTDVFRNFVFPAPVEGTRYVRALELRPGNKRIVHHANVLVDRHGSSRRLDEDDREVGFAGMELEIESESFDPHTHFLFWKPGTAPLVEPDETSWRLDGGTDLIVNMHLQPSGRIEAVQPSIGLYFSSKAPELHPMLLQFENDGAINIPPGEKNFVVTDRLELPVDVDVLGVYPHAHYLGKRVEAFATLPDGTRKWLLRIRQWDFNWQAVYRYAKPVFLPKQTVVHMAWTYDNSADNVRNPHQPPRQVVAGDRSSDEMAHLWVQVLPRGGEDRRLELQVALMLRRLEKYPGDFTAHFNLGAALQAMNKPEEAIVQLRNAIAARPDSATAHNNLGSALYDVGRVEEAASHFRRAVRTRPDYASAHYNLGQAYAGRGEFGNAITHFQRAAQLLPNDAAIRADLGTALLTAGRFDEAIRQLNQALKMDSQSLNAHYNLASVFLMHGRFEKAEQHFREALRLKSDDADIHAGLGTALAAQKRLPEAVVQFEKALRLNPEHGVARSNLGLATAGGRPR
ncbi:MAG TPA: tetratricopeptide repeat protein [Pirellulaceae bacterium]|nr:tetratricopeptide repeat protein [Pirellulaceae bacterium]